MSLKNIFLEISNKNYEIPNDVEIKFALRDEKATSAMVDMIITGAKYLDNNPHLNPDWVNINDGDYVELEKHIINSTDPFNKRYIDDVMDYVYYVDKLGWENYLKKYKK